MSSLVLWILFDVTDYGLEKLLNFLLITIPISIVINEKFNESDRNFFIITLLGISIFRTLICIYDFSSLVNSRSGVLGGGTIVLSRWLCFGSIILFFHPKFPKIKYVFVLMLIIISFYW